MKEEDYFDYVVSVYTDLLVYEIYKNADKLKETLLKFKENLKEINKEIKK